MASIHQAADRTGSICPQSTPPSSHSSGTKLREQLVKAWDSAAHVQHHTIREDGSRFPGEEFTPHMVSALKTVREADAGSSWASSTRNGRNTAGSASDAVPVFHPGSAAGRKSSVWYGIFDRHHRNPRSGRTNRCAWPRRPPRRPTRSKDRFLAVLSHELRTPLTPVLMTLGALEHDPGLRAEDARGPRDDQAEHRARDQADRRPARREPDHRAASWCCGSRRWIVNEALRHTGAICQPQLQRAGACGWSWRSRAEPLDHRRRSPRGSSRCCGTW